jgi:hypothetical protein
MNQTTSQPLLWSGSFAQDTFASQFELRRQKDVIKSIGQSLLGGYQQFMTQSARGKRTANLEHIPSSFSIDIKQIGENVDPTECVCECVAIKQRGRQVITAVCTIGHQLNLFSWRVNADGAVVRTGTSGPQPGQVAQIAIARARKFVTAFRTATRQLQLISWDVSNTGAIYRAGSSRVSADETAGATNDAVGKVKLVALNDTLLVTTCTTPTGQVKLTSWRLNDNDTFTQLHDYIETGEYVRDLVPIVLPPTAAGARIVTAVRTQTGQFKLQLWNVTLAGEITIGAASIIAKEKIGGFDAVAENEGRLITSVRTLNGRLKLIVWHCTPDGQMLERLFDSGVRGERIRKHSLMFHAAQVMTAVQTAAGQYKLIAWTMPGAGSIVRISESVAPSVAGAPIGLCQETLDGNAPLLTSGLTVDGALKLMTWCA